MDTKFSILVATKNREHKLINLINSFNPIKSYINELIIVASGKNIEKVLQTLELREKIKYIHSEIENQNYQKFLGISSLSSGEKWVWLLDDDVVVDFDSTLYMIHNYINKQHEYCGVGLAVRNIETRNSGSLLKRLFLKSFFLWSGTPGKVLQSGHAQSYFDSKTICKTEWLNGISLWKASSLKMYPNLKLTHSYSAYEDVIFSYKISRGCQLLYDPNMFVQSQELEYVTHLNSIKMIAAAKNRKLFVEMNKLSSMKLLISQIFRGIYYLSIHNGESFKHKFKTFIKSIMILAI